MFLPHIIGDLIGPIVQWENAGTSTIGGNRNMIEMVFFTPIDEINTKIA